jgi:hypothetical protein
VRLQVFRAGSSRPKIGPLWAEIAIILALIAIVTVSALLFLSGGLDSILSSVGGQT